MTSVFLNSLSMWRPYFSKIEMC